MIVEGSMTSDIRRVNDVKVARGAGSYIIVEE